MKASGSYPSIVQGVSQQVPHKRRPGQSTEQVNMLPDPVQGLSRRHGTKLVGEVDLGINPTLFATLSEDTKSWRTFEYSNAGSDYVVLYRTTTAPAGTSLPPLMVYNRTANTFLQYSRNVTDALLDQMSSGGISAITAIGRYVFMAGRTTVPTASSFDVWGSADNQKESVVWVRGGAYARKFTGAATKTDGTVVSFEYTTPTSSYPGTLDTSGVPVYAADPAGGTQSDTEAAYVEHVGSTYVAKLGWAAWSPTALSVKKGVTTLSNVYPSTTPGPTEYSWNTGAGTVLFNAAAFGALDITLTYTHTKTVTNPNYTKAVSDISNAFNTAVTNWIGTAAAAIQPAAIAESLRLAAVAAGLTGGVVQTNTLIFSNVKGLVVTDGGDGTLIRGVSNEVTSIDQVSSVHKIGKVVKVRARSAEEAFYLIAVPKDKLGPASGYTEVTWVEAPGTIHTIANAVLYGTVDGGQFHVASTAALMNVLLPLNHPTYSPSLAGDVDSSPLPFFINRNITWLGVFQDRLLVGSGAVVRASKIGDYLNFFRSSILTVPASDPLEMLARNSEDDELRYSVLYDRNLVIFGKKRQYAISGRVALTPTSANMEVMTNHEGAGSLPPLAVGATIFYGKVGDDSSSSVHQIQPSLTPDSPESFLVSSQLDSYLSGAAVELSACAKPSVLFVRTDKERNTLYAFHYLDSQGEGRKQDAWHKLVFNDALGVVFGTTSVPDGMLVYSLRVSHGTTWMVVDRLTLVATISETPYLDSQRPLSAVQADTGSVRLSTTGDWHGSYDSSSVYRFLGSSLADVPAYMLGYPGVGGMVVGAAYDSYYRPTNPFMRDRSDNPVTIGRLVVTQMVVSLGLSSGMLSNVSYGAYTFDQEYNGRVLGSPDNIIGREVITTYQQTVPVGRETREFTLTLKARKWLPFTITSLEWVGQWFSRTQRF